MSDQRQSIPPQPREKSNSTVIFIVGGLVVAVGVLAYVFSNDSTPDANPTADTAPAVSIENNTTTPAPADPAAAPAPAEVPAEPAPAEPEAAPADPAPAPAEPAPAPAPAPAAPANP